MGGVAAETESGKFSVFSHPQLHVATGSFRAGYRVISIKHTPPRKRVSFAEHSLAGAGMTEPAES